MSGGPRITLTDVLEALWMLAAILMSMALSLLLLPLAWCAGAALFVLDMTREAEQARADRRRARTRAAEADDEAEIPNVDDGRGLLPRALRWGAVALLVLALALGAATMLDGWGPR